MAMATTGMLTASATAQPTISVTTDVVTPGQSVNVTVTGIPGQSFALGGSSVGAGRARGGGTDARGAVHSGRRPRLVRRALADRPRPAIWLAIPFVLVATAVFVVVYALTARSRRSLHLP